ncbi:uncharacterized protein LOC126176415 [Schistocerca cancellata]|uniref:uncharacterized protein LOC126176415 n=1 Tax=Schistocerca cancellata TaxID=274614 RepID=UPI002119B5D8|nr:uncharacterized protein LOC126176415 [Schistocerca cancellata]
MTTAQVALIWLLFATAAFAEPEKPPQPVTFLRPPSPSSEPRSVVQRVARWFFSSGDDEAGHHEDYGRPPPPSSPPHPSGSHGRHGSLKSNYGPPRFKYGPPKPPTTHYGPPKTSNQHEFPSGPPPGFFISRPEGKPLKRPDLGDSHYLRSPKPPANQYGPPKTPSSSYGPPKPTSNYGPPTNAHGGPSVSSPASYISLKPPSISGPPLTPPSIHYGSPKPTGSSGQSSIFHGPLRPSRPPSPTYGSPGLLTSHRPPSPGYGPPRSPGIVSHPKPPKKDCNPCNRVPWVPMSVGGVSDLPPSSSASSGGLYLPSPSSSYVPPPPLNIPGASAYNSGNAAVGIEGHIGSGSNGQSGHIHTSHTNSNGSPGNYGPPPIPPLLQIPNIQYGASESTASASTVGSIQQGPAYLPTISSSQSHQQTAAETQNGIYGGSTEGDQSLDIVKSVTLLSESYPPTINTPGQNSQLYQSPVHLIPASNPNWPSPPTAHSSISEAGNNAFTDQHTLESEFTQHTKTKGHGGSELEVIKSVPLADFVSSIEYPIEVIQSPSYVDVSPDAPVDNDGNSIHSAEQKVRENPEYLPKNEEIVIGKPVLKGELNIKQVAQSTSNEGYKNHNGDDSGNLSNNVNQQGENDQSDQKQSGSIKQPINVNSVVKDQTEGSDLKSEGNNFYLGTTHQSPQSFSLPSSHYSNENSFNAGNKNITFPQDVQSQTKDNKSGFGVSTQQHSTSTDNVYGQDHSQTNDQPLLEQTSGLDFHQQSNVLLQPPRQQSGNNYYLVPQGQNVLPSQKTPSLLQSGFVKPPEGQRVIVDIQPSVQTSAQGASLIYQINNLKAPPPTAPYPNGFPNRPTQTAVFVSFQNGLQGATAPQSVPPAVPPPGPGPVHDSFVRPPNSFRNPLIAFQSLYKPDIPAQFLNPPGINPPPIWSQSAEDYSAPWANAGGPPPFKYLPDSSAVASFSSPGLYPPPPVPLPQQEPTQQTPQQGHKRPKKIQVIVPYTSTKDLAQFPSAGSQNAADLNAGPWTPVPQTNQGVAVSEQQPVPQVNCSDPQKPWQGYIFCYPSQFYISQPSDNSQDYQQHQESRPATQKATIQNHPQLKNHQTVSKTGEIQHIFASNIRELLRGEEEVKNVTEDTLLRLQKNIDEWTALAYSKHNRAEERKTTTPKPPVSALRHRLVSSKQIPEEYLTTTPLPYDDINQNVGPFAPTAVPALKPSTASSSPPISSRFFDHEAAGSYSHAVTANAYDRPSQKKTNGVSEPVDHKWKFFENNLVLPEAVTVLTTTVASTAATVTPAEEQVTTEAAEERQKTDTEPEVPTTPPPTTQAPWTNLQVSISPITKERVYVVTPLSSWEQQQLEGTTTPTAQRRYTPGESYREGKSQEFDFHSPRFVVRPTPATTLPLQTLFSAADGGARADDRSSTVHEDANSTASAGNTLFDDFVSLFSTGDSSLEGRRSCLDFRAHLGSELSLACPLISENTGSRGRPERGAAASIRKRRRGLTAAAATARGWQVKSIRGPLHPDWQFGASTDAPVQPPPQPPSPLPLLPPPPPPPMAMRSRAGAVFLRLLDVPTYSPPDAAAIHTITGHSKVSTAATSATPGGRTSRDSYLRHFPDPVLDGKAQQDLSLTAADHTRSQKPSS